jgi:ribose 5-phosphate isomerase A
MTPESYALDQIRSGQLVGLGTGRAAERFVRALGARIADGLAVRGVATSRAPGSRALVGIPLVAPDEVSSVDVAHGADEVDPRGRLIKGYGGALLREKIVAASAARVVILVGPEKCVPRLGTRGRLPVEVLPAAWASVRPRLERLGVPGAPRPQRSDNGNLLVDCRIGPLSDASEPDRAPTRSRVSSRCPSSSSSRRRRSARGHRDPRASARRRVTSISPEACRTRARSPVIRNGGWTA